MDITTFKNKLKLTKNKAQHTQTRGMSNPENMIAFYRLTDLNDGTNLPYRFIVGQVGTDYTKVITERDDRYNTKNYIVLGEPGSGKTSSYITPNVYQSITQRESFIVTGDATSSIYDWYRQLGDIVIGYKTYHIDFIHSKKSDGWNILDLLIDRDTMQVNAAKAWGLTRALLGNVAGNDTDLFRNECIKNLFIACIGLASYRHEYASTNETVAQQAVPQERPKFNLEQVYSIVKNVSACQSEFKKMHNDCFGKKEFDIYDSLPISLKDRVIAGLQYALRALENADLLHMLSTDGIDLRDLKNTNAACFVTNDIAFSDTTPFISAFIYEAYDSAMRTFDYNYAQAMNSNLPARNNPITMYLDEFASMGLLGGDKDWFTACVSGCRTRKINTVVAINSINELARVTSESELRALLSLFGTTIYLGCADIESINHIYYAVNKPFAYISSAMSKDISSDSETLSRKEIEQIRDSGKALVAHAGIPPIVVNTVIWNTYPKEFKEKAQYSAAEKGSYDQ